MQGSKHLRPVEIDALIPQVQRNCDVSDSAYAADYTLCIYLMRMREYYRWEQGLDWTDSLPQKALIRWIADKERYWESLEKAALSPINFAGKTFSPFDQAGMNALLIPLGYVYQAGYGRGGKPIFVLAELIEHEQTERYTLLTLGRELARELVSPVAATRENEGAGENTCATKRQEIYLRTHALKRLIWDLVEEWRWHKPDNAMSEVIKRYDFDAHPRSSLTRATEEQAEMLVLHEIGEVIAGELLDARWNDWLQAQSGEPGELFARAARDCLADCLVTLPGLLSLNDEAGLHFYFANLTPLRKSMFPSLVKAYREWRKTGEVEAVKRSVRQGQQHWRYLANGLVSGQQPLLTIEKLVAAHAL